MKFIVEEAVTGNILSRDLAVLEPKVTPRLTGAATMEFMVPHGDWSTEGFSLKPWGQFIHCEQELLDGRRVITASCIVNTCIVDPETSALRVTAEGFSNYGKGIPWLDNYNPIAEDPFAIVARIWWHLQGQPNGDIGVQVLPASSNTILLPGFSFDGTEFILNFFCIFIRQTDFRDCADEMNKLARDIPFDYLELSEWNYDRTAVNRTLLMSYPRRGVERNELAFRLGENVLNAVPKAEAEIDWVSDVLIRGWLPGRVSSAQLSNHDPTRFRRIVKEEDVAINSQERAAVWAKRRLARKQIPPHFESITIDGFHPAAPFGSWELGDEIFVQAEFPWLGPVAEWHRIMSYSFDDATGKCELELKHRDAFNYDAIELLE